MARRGLRPSLEKDRLISGHEVQRTIDSAPTTRAVILADSPDGGSSVVSTTAHAIEDKLSVK